MCVLANGDRASAAQASDPASGTRPPEAMLASLDAVAPLALGNANVIMQLALLPVGRGVAESPVESGRVDKHPIKRLRTTMSFLAIAMLGTDEERRGLRQEIDGQHRQVRSGPGDPVAYNAFDPELQLWVAACLWRGTEDALNWLYPGLSDEQLDACYAWAERFGTTLQVRPGMWPADRDTFEAYWQDGVARIRMDDVTRRYLQNLTLMRGLPAPVRGIANRTMSTLTLGFLPERFRDELGLPWTPSDQARFDRMARILAAVNRASPRFLRQAPMKVYLWDVRRRLRTGRPVV
jgi:uncharacterized protein (DUF2236 family)